MWGRRDPLRADDLRQRPRRRVAPRGHPEARARPERRRAVEGGAAVSADGRRKGESARCPRHRRRRHRLRSRARRRDPGAPGRARGAGGLRFRYFVAIHEAPSWRYTHTVILCQWWFFAVISNFRGFDLILFVFS